MPPPARQKSSSWALAAPTPSAIRSCPISTSPITVVITIVRMPQARRAGRARGRDTGAVGATRERGGGYGWWAWPERISRDTSPGPTSSRVTASSLWSRHAPSTSR